MSGFRAGFAQVDVTPPAGTPMAGYPDVAVDRPWTPDAIRGYVGRQRQVATGTHDPLLATAVAVECDGVKAVVVGLDTLVVERAWTDALRAALAPHGVTPERVLVGASHTHGGPDLYAWWEGEPARAPAPATLAGTVEACERALAALEPVELRFGVARLEDASVNRRDERNGVVDPRVSVLRAVRPDGTTAGLLVSWACHPVTLDYANVEFTADYVGPLRDLLAVAYPGAGIAFVNGAAGNLNPARHPYEQRLNVYEPQTLENRPVYWGGFEEAARLGRTVAGAAVQAAERALPLAPAAPAGRLVPLRLPLKQPGPLERHLEFMAFESEAYVARMRASDGLDSEVQLLSIGELRLLGLPGEVFVEIADEIRADAGPGPLVVLGYANDDVRYVLTDDAYDGGQYETVGTPLAEGSAGALVAVARAALG